MALKIIDKEIVGKIDNLEDKLDGKLPVDILELLYLINSWGRTKSFYAFNLNQDISIKTCESKKCYDLSKLDTSKITNMNEIFKNSKFNGDISTWDVSNVTNMLDMFFFAKDFNQPINDWDTSNVTNMSYMFYEARSFNQPIDSWDISKVIEMSYMFAKTLEFNQNISSWNLENIINCDYIFKGAESFLDKYNSGEPLPNRIDEIKKWFNLNRDKMDAIDIKEKYGKEVDNFFNKIQTNSIQKKEI